METLNGNTTDVSESSSTTLIDKTNIDCNSGSNVDSPVTNNGDNVDKIEISVEPESLLDKKVNGIKDSQIDGSVSNKSDSIKNDVNGDKETGAVDTRIDNNESSEKPEVDLMVDVKVGFERDNETVVESSETCSDCYRAGSIRIVDMGQLTIKDAETENDDVENSAFINRQDDSGTDDSDSDSDSSSESDMSDVLSSSEESDKEQVKSESCKSSSDEEVVEKRPIRTTNDSEKNGVAKLKKKPKGTKYKGELDLDDLPPIEDLHITVPEEDCEPLGTVYSIVNQLVVVHSMENRPALNLDSVLFTKQGGCLGQIFDVFGPVKTPFYTLRFNSNQEITDRGIEVGQTVYCAPQTPHTKYVFVYQLMKQKGSDASWRHNYEVPESLQDYSDDEEEKKAKRKHSQKTRDRPGGKRYEREAPLRKQIKSEFVPNYDQYTKNDWYQARVSELNQFNRNFRGRWNTSHHQQRNSNQLNDYRPNNIQEGGNFDQSFPSMQPIVRPSTPNNWNPPPSNVLNNDNRNFFSPPPCPPMNPCVSSNFSDTPFHRPPPAQFSTPPPQNRFAYEKLNSSPNFSNPVQHGHPNRAPFNQQRNYPPFGHFDSARRTDSLPPRPMFPPPLHRPNQSNDWHSFAQPPPPGY